MLVSALLDAAGVADREAEMVDETDGVTLLLQEGLGVAVVVFEAYTYATPCPNCAPTVLLLAPTIAVVPLADSDTDDPTTSNAAPSLAAMRCDCTQAVPLLANS